MPSFNSLKCFQCSVCIREMQVNVSEFDKKTRMVALPVIVAIWTLCRLLEPTNFWRRIFVIKCSLKNVGFHMHLYRGRTLTGPGSDTLCACMHTFLYTFHAQKNSHHVCCSRTKIPIHICHPRIRSLTEAKPRGGEVEGQYPVEFWNLPQEILIDWKYL